jgi:hypothetical protein
MVTTATHTNARKSVTVPFTSPTAKDETLVTLTVTAEELMEIQDALASHKTSWQVEKNTAQGRKSIHWSKKSFITDGSFLFVGGKAKSAYSEIGKTRTLNKYALIHGLSKRIRELASQL